MHYRKKAALTSHLWTSGWLPCPWHKVVDSVTGIPFSLSSPWFMILSLDSTRDKHIRGVRIRNEQPFSSA